MTEPHSDGANGAHNLVFEILGNFSHVQSMIDDGLAGIFLRSRIPATGKVLHGLAIERIRDSERPRLVAAIATDLGKTDEIDTGVFSSTYSEVKTTRDRIGHASEIAVQADGSVRLATFGTPKKVPPGSDPYLITADELERAALSCGWMSAVVNFLIFSMYAPIPIRPGVISYPKAPCRLPKDWHGGMRVESVEFPDPGTH